MKRVLFDEQMPRALRRDLADYSVRTVQEEGWSAFSNGDLLSRAMAKFDVLVTLDRRMQHQQKIANFDIGIVVIEAHRVTLPNLRRSVPEIRSAIELAKPGTIMSVKA